MPRRSSWTSVIAVAAFLACGSNDEPKDDNSCGGRSCPFDYTEFDASTPSVSFETDVMPVFRRACGFSVCHGKESGSAAELYLGPKCPPADDDPTCTQGVPDSVGRQAILDSIVGVVSKTASTMHLVTAASPEQSFLMLKVDGCHNGAGLSCTVQDGAKTSGACGDPMPQSSDALCQSERDLIRRWIAQGAANN